MDSSRVSFVMGVFIACSMLVVAVGGKSNATYGWYREEFASQTTHISFRKDLIQGNIYVAAAMVYRPLPYPLLAGASPQKRAYPFDMGGGIVNPRAAADPVLIYDMSLTDYIQYLYAMGYENSSLSRFIHEAQCPRTKPTILDMNLPSITISGLENVMTVRRTVTNVGHPKSVYQVEVEPPLGTTVMVRPGVLVFEPGISKQSFEVEVTAMATENTNAGYYFGSMTWRDRLHSVRIPIAVRMVTRRSLFSTTP